MLSNSNPHMYQFISVHDEIRMNFAYKMDLVMKSACANVLVRNL